MPNRYSDRRTFLKLASLTTLSSLVGMDIVNGKYLPKGLLPLALENGYPGKDDRLTVLNERPVNMETPAHLLTDERTPRELFFVRNNGLPPKEVDADAWKLTVGGESAMKELSFSIADLKSTFEVVDYELTLECGGNGRKEYNPPAKGNQWSVGAVGCAKWTGVRLRDVLRHVGLQSDAVYIGYHGADTHLSGDPSKQPISRGVPIEKALEPESMIAWAMNDKPLPMLNGYPLRLVFGGWPASCSGKWLQKIVVRNQVHDGAKMGGQSYRVPCSPVPPGAKVADEDMCIIEAMPVKSLITYPKSGAMISTGQQLPISGHAWSGYGHVTKVEYSVDFGVSWHECKLTTAANRHAWQHFSAEVTLPEKGYYEVWSRASDSAGASQPMIVPGWNPKGYLNNACHRIAVKVLA